MTILAMVYGILIVILLNLIVILLNKNDELKRELKITRTFISLDECGDCVKCEDEGDFTCPFYGDPNGCNNRYCAECYRRIHGKEVAE